MLGYLAVVIGLICVNGSAFASSTDERAEFRILMSRLAQQTQAQPMKCKESRGSAPQDVLYRLELRDAPDFRDAFFVHYWPQKSNLPDWSALIAYEGENGYVMGRLERQVTGDEVAYTHGFHGMYDDITKLVLKESRITQFHFRKLSRGGLIGEITCALE